MVRKYLPSLETFSESDGIAIIDAEEKLLPEIVEIASLDAYVEIGMVQVNPCTLLNVE